ncbi:MAG: J domain-containing protein [Desulfuromonadales bacterium]|nr:J domain-containing protein [Desulfuromonadales bacterium]
MTYNDLCSAIEILGLPKQASRKEIKQRHRILVKAHHPDGKGETAEDFELIRKINAAYALLRDYCDNYRFSFDYDTFMIQNPEERIREQFSTDPIWGGGGEEGR